MALDRSVMGKRKLQQCVLKETRQIHLGSTVTYECIIVKGKPRTLLIIHVDLFVLSESLTDYKMLFIILIFHY